MIKRKIKQLQDIGLATFHQSGKPYFEVSLENFILRKFSSLTDDYEFEWHIDDKDRLIYVLNSDNWMYQFDGELPHRLEPNSYLLIEKGKWHRVLKGNGILEIIIYEFLSEEEKYRISYE